MSDNFDDVSGFDDDNKVEKENQNSQVESISKAEENTDNKPFDPYAEENTNNSTSIENSFVTQKSQNDDESQKDSTDIEKSISDKNSNELTKDEYEKQELINQMEQEKQDKKSQNNEKEEEFNDSKKTDNGIPKKKNLADKINHKNIWIIIGGIIVVLLGITLIIPDLLPKRKEKQKQEEMNYSSQPPSFIDSYEFTESTQKVEDKSEEDKIREEKQSQLPEAKTVEEVEEKLKLAVELENEKNKTSNKPKQGSTTPNSSSRPETNRNEQQKRTTRMEMSDKSFQELVGNSNNQVTNGYGDYRQNYNDSIAQRNEVLAKSLGSLNQGQVNDGVSPNQRNKQTFYQNNQGNNNFKFNAEHTLWEGTIIPAVLVTGINTDNPGVVIARVTSNVYSSQNGKYLLIPEGTQLFATYNSSISYGQNRVQIAWNKLIRPDGFELDLGNMNGVDTQGRSGQKGFVNEHPFQIAKALGVIAMFSILNTKIEILPTTNQYSQNAISDVYSEIQKMEANIINRSLDIQPTITVGQFTPVNLITNKTLELPPMEVYKVKQKYVRTGR